MPEDTVVAELDTATEEETPPETSETETSDAPETEDSDVPETPKGFDDLSDEEKASHPWVKDFAAKQSESRRREWETEYKRRQQDDVGRKENVVQITSVMLSRALSKVGIDAS